MDDRSGVISNELYGRKIWNREILTGKVPTPQAGQSFFSAISST